MKPTILAIVLFAATFCAAQEKPVVLQAGTLLDGRGHVFHNVQIVVQGGRIIRIDQNGKATPSYDLGKLTVLPGFIDVHDHITWHFGPNGHIDDKTETPAQATPAPPNHSICKTKSAQSHRECRPISSRSTATPSKTSPPCGAWCL